MIKQLVILVSLVALVATTPATSSAAGGGRSHGGGIRSHGAHGLGNGLAFGFGGGGYSDIYGYAELYRELYNNLPYFALHPPVYYSVPVPRTYGYSPFAYPGDIMTPEIVAPVQPVTIINPHVKSGPESPATPAKDKAAASQREVQPLVINNPFVVGRNVAQSEQ